MTPRLQHTMCSLALCALLAMPTALFGAEEKADVEPSLDNTEALEAAGEDLAETMTGDVKPDQNFMQQAYKIGYSVRPIFGGPNSPEGQLEETDRVTDPAFRLPGIYKATEPWRDWKRGLNDNYGLQFSGHYTTLYQQASESVSGEDKASSGVLRANAKWELLNRGESNPGALLVTIDHRHAYRDIAPADLAGEIGYVGVTGTMYSDIDFTVVNLNWQQALNDSDAGLIIGRYDPNDYMNVQGYVNPWTLFSNVSILLDSSVAYPDAGWGAAGGSWFKKQWYFTAGFNDANGKLSDDLEFFDGGAEFFKWVEFGWSPGKENRYFKNVHVTTWHVDERDDAVVDSGQGLMFAANWTYNERWMPFVRAGWSNGAEQVVIYDRTATVGFVWKYMKRSDAAGLAINWGSPPDSSLSDQTTIEGFWRFQFAQNFEITPSVQFLLNPALNSDEDEILLFGLRMRLTF